MASGLYVHPTQLPLAPPRVKLGLLSNPAVKCGLCPIENRSGLVYAHSQPQATTLGFPLAAPGATTLASGPFFCGHLSGVGTSNNNLHTPTGLRQEAFPQYLGLPVRRPPTRCEIMVRPPRRQVENLPGRHTLFTASLAGGPPYSIHPLVGFRPPLRSAPSGLTAGTPAATDAL